MMQQNTLWLSDFSTVAPSRRRLARYALQLVQGGSTPNKLWYESRFMDALWGLLQPLMTPQGVENVLTPKNMGEDDSEWDAETLEDMQHTPGSYEVSRRHLRQYFMTLPEGLLPRLQHADAVTPLPMTVQILREGLDLDDSSLRILDWIYRSRQSESLRLLLRNYEQSDYHLNIQRMAGMLALSETTLRQTLQHQAPLRHLGLIEMGVGETDLEDFLLASDLLRDIFAVQPENTEALLRVVIEPAPQASLTLTAFPHLKAESQRLQAALHHTTGQPWAGMNALFYGKPGTGKTELARAVIQASGLQAWQVRSADGDQDGLSRHGRLSAYLVAQRLLSRRPGAVLIFDEIEDVFDAPDPWIAFFQPRHTHGQQKGWMNRILEENPVPAIWITNAVERMDPAFIRRFLFPVSFKTPPRSVRQQMVEYHLGDCQISPEVLDNLAADALLTPAQFSAARRLLELHPEASPEQTIQEGVGALRAVLHGSALSRQRRIGTAFDLAFLNLAGQDTPQAIVQALQRQGHGSVCFSGPPGTGKTAFAEILATALDRELITQSAADLISPYIGESEKNLADLFQNHDPSQTILFLDEVDSFLSERRQARHSWERTAVNELLQQMERYPGIFLAATNLIERVDQAALRRFDFKLQFRPLNKTQRRALLARETLGDQQQPLPTQVTSLLDQLTHLTPGDFATVYRQQQMLGQAFTPEQFLQRLLQEQRWKHNASAQAHPQPTMGNHF